jgi:hypothetical protein
MFVKTDTPFACKVAVRQNHTIQISFLTVLALLINLPEF